MKHRKQAEQFKKKYGLKKITAASLIEVLEKMGYTVIGFNGIEEDENVAILRDELRLAKYMNQCSCFTFRNEIYRLVFLHEDLSQEEQKLVLAHEIGHIVNGHLMQDCVFGEDVLQEHEANEFAHFLLYPGMGKIRMFHVALASCTLAVLVLGIFVKQRILPDIKYAQAMTLVEKGQYIDAYRELEELNGFKDSSIVKSSIHEKYEDALIREAEVGSTIIFGLYEQDKDYTDGEENIEWIVMMKEDGKLLVTSKYVLDCRPYHTVSDEGDWEESAIRAWLNGNFLATAFSGSETARICLTAVDADKNPVYETVTDNMTDDKIFLLSDNKTDVIFFSEELRQCEATAYARAQGVETNELRGSCSWWVRTPGQTKAEVAYVNDNGKIDFKGLAKDTEGIGVRPAMWIYIEE